MSAVLKFLAAVRSLANQGLSKQAIEQFAKNEFGEISELLQRQIDNIYKQEKGIPSIKKDPDFDDTVIQMQIDEFGPFNPKDPLKNLKKQTENQKYNQSLLEQKGINFLKKNLEKEKKQLEKVTELEKISRELLEDIKKGKPPKDEKAEGGRIGLKDGMSRRKFMQIMGGIAALPIVGKFFKLGKVATKAAPIVKTPPVPGKPEWFDSLVNKVITEGDDMTKKFATKEREIVHATKIDNDAFVTVTRDLDDGKVRVDISDPTTNVMDDQGEAIVSMEFKPGMADETTKGAKPADEFTATETDYRNYQDGPDDFITEAIENTVTDTKDLTSDLTKVKMYAKGQKKPTIKEMMIQRDRAKTLRQAEENPAEYAADRGPDIDYSDYDDFASGGIAGMLGE